MTEKEFEVCANPTAEMLERSRVIENPNSSGQGHCPHHMENPHHAILVEHGYSYSHTTMVGYGYGYYSIHTYRFQGTDWCVSVENRPGFMASASKLGSGHRTTMFHNRLKRYLKRKRRELAASK